ncbi:MAG: N-6 DNA methylase [Candidatus Paceibacterota bacterium]
MKSTYARKQLYFETSVAASESLNCGLIKSWCHRRFERLECCPRSECWTNGDFPLPKQFGLGSLWLQMAKEQFFYPATQPLFKQLEQLSQRSSVSRGQAFEDFLTAVVCALAAETKEGEYMAMIERHKCGKPGQRGADLMPQMFGELVNAMSESDADILGDLFQGSITYGEAGQYFTPESVTKLMAKMSVDPDARPTSDRAIYIQDPCCGTGRMLLEASKINPHAELVGQDIDARCAKARSRGEIKARSRRSTSELYPVVPFCLIWKGGIRTKIASDLLDLAAIARPKHLRQCDNPTSRKWTALRRVDSPTANGGPIAGITEICNRAEVSRKLDSIYLKCMRDCLAS